MADDEGSLRKRRKLSHPDSGPIVLRPVTEDIPLQPEPGSDAVSITCVEYWNGHLYIGTSASEILHLFLLPSDDQDETTNPTYILASRLQPSGYGTGSSGKEVPGVQRILVFPGPSKACVLCNGVVSFYTLPELSPAFPNKEPTGVQWIGGLDENADQDNPDGPVVMIANSKRILMVRVGEKLRQIKHIDYPGCLRSCRRDTIACVADEKSYALLEVEHQQKIPLFPIMSTADAESPVQEQPPPKPTQSPTREESRRGQGHTRSTSLGQFLTSKSPERVAYDNNDTRIEEVGNEEREETSPQPRPRSSTDTLPVRTSSLFKKDRSSPLHPLLISPSPSEFMLTTGTGLTEPGVGLFVNLDGDIVRGTVEFTTYPEDVLIDDFVCDEEISANSSGDRTAFIMALLKKTKADKLERGLEIQKLPENSPDESRTRHWLPIAQNFRAESSVGLWKTLSSYSHTFTDVAELLRTVPLKMDQISPHIKALQGDFDPRTSSAVAQLEQEKALFDGQSGASTPVDISPELIDKRLAEETKFARRLGHTQTKNVVWSDGQLFQILQNPLIIQLESELSQFLQDDHITVLDTQYLFDLLTRIRDREPSNETEFLTLNYIRQKVGLMLFIHLQSIANANEDHIGILNAIENALHEGALDPRVVLHLIPALAMEVLQGPQGIWLHQGIVKVASKSQSSITSFNKASIEFWMMIRHYLTLWQEKRGYGSISDEKYVFDSVDAALLHVLLHLDSALPVGSGVQASVRAKLNNVVDHWKGNFGRAIILLEQYHHLFVLSRLYQSKKLAKDVLATWKRIVEGEEDVDYGTNVDQVEIRIRGYLTVIRDSALVKEYGMWLAQRNPTLAIQVFTDDSSRVKFVPQQVVEMFKENAPSAVQQYLEHLVFAKHLDQYADDLIGYYLDSVLNVLENSAEARESLAQSYTTYRTLTSPKPTYLNFIRDNAPPDEWWQARLRLLQLLGAGGYSATSASKEDLTYSVSMVLERMAPYSSYLVSESVILDARQGRHEEALRLLTHGLGDYDTAVRYCYFGSPYASSSTTVDVSQLPPRELQQELFQYLFHEFLIIEDIDERLERTSQLLGKFATWFDPVQILMDIPDDWTVAMLSDFLLRSFRAATSARNEAVIIKALSAAQNLQKQAEFIEVCEKIGSKIEEEREGNSAPDPSSDIEVRS